MPNAEIFWTDRDVAEYLSMSASWVRVQRMKRNNNEDHIFQVNHICIGGAVRYRVDEVVAWADELSNTGGSDA